MNGSRKYSNQWKRIASILIITMCFTLVPSNLPGLGIKAAEAASVSLSGGNIGDLVVNADTNYVLTAGTTTNIGTITVNGGSITFSGEGNAIINRITSPAGVDGIEVTKESDYAKTNGTSSGNVTIYNQAATVTIDSVTTGIGGNAKRGTWYDSAAGQMLVKVGIAGDSGRITIHNQNGNLTVKAVKGGNAGTASTSDNGNSYGGAGGSAGAISLTNSSSGRLTVETITGGNGGHGSDITYGSSYYYGGDAGKGSDITINNTVQGTLICNTVVGGAAGSAGAKIGSTGSQGKGYDGGSITINNKGYLQSLTLTVGNGSWNHQQGNIVIVNDKLMYLENVPTKTATYTTNTANQKDHISVLATKVSGIDCRSKGLTTKKTAVLKLANSISANDTINIRNGSNANLITFAPIAVVNTILVTVPADQLIMGDYSGGILIEDLTRLPAFKAPGDDYIEYTAIAMPARTATFYPNGGNLNSANSQTVVTGTKLTEPNEPTRGGYVFKGWYQNAVGTGNAWSFGSDVLNNDIALYAKWMPGPPSFTRVWLTPEGWTKSEVTLHIEAASIEGALKYSFDAGMNWQVTGEKTFTKNVQLAANSVQIKDNAGNIVSYPSSITIDTIDNTAPNIVSVNKSTENKVDTIELLVSAFDLQSGIDLYSFDGGVTWQRENYKSYDEITMLEANMVQVRDIAGNVAKYPSKVNIDNVKDIAAPTIKEVVVSPEEWIQEDVTVLIDATDNVAIAGYSFDGGVTWQQENYKKYSSNQTITANSLQVKDTSDNRIKYGQAVQINQIDRTAPTTPKLTKTADNQFTLTAGIDQESGIEQTEFCTYTEATRKLRALGTWIVYNGQTITIQPHEFIMARSVDKAGNVSPVVSAAGSAVILPEFVHEDIISNQPVTIEIPLQSGYQYSYQLVKDSEGASAAPWIELTPSKQSIQVTEEGRYQAQLKMQHLQNNLEVRSKPFAIVFDQTAPSAPSITVDQQPTGSKITVSPGTDILSGVDKTVVLFNGEQQPPEATEGAQTIWRITQPGDYTITAVTVDQAGNRSTEAKQEIHFADQTAPVIEEVTITPDTWTNQAVTVQITATDEVAIGGYSFDGGTTWQSEGGKTYDQNQSIAAKQLQVKDNAGNIALYPQIVEITQIDKQPPTAPELTKLAANQFYILPGTDEASGVKQTEYCKYQEGSSQTPLQWIVWDNKAVSIKATEYLMVRSQDQAGNYSAISAAAGTGISLPSYQHDDVLSNQPVEIVVPMEHPEYQYSYQLIEKGKQTTTKQTALQQTAEDQWFPLTDAGHTIAVSTEGSYEVTVRMVHKETFFTITGKPFAVLVDQTAPSEPQIKTTKTAQGITVNIQPGEDTLSGVQETTVLINGRQQAASAGLTWQITTPGSYTFTARTMDKAGNASAEAIKELSFADTQAPEIQGIGLQPAGWTKEAVIVQIKATDNLGIAGYSFDGGATWQTEAGKAYVKNQVLAAEQLQVKDVAGHMTSYPQAIEITQIDRTIPTAPKITKVREDQFQIAPGTDEQSGVERTEYFINSTDGNGSWQILKAADKVLTIGSTDTLMARSIDNAGNASIVSYAFGSAVELPDYSRDNIISNEPVTIPVEINREDFLYAYQVLPHGDALGTSWSDLDTAQNKISIEEEGRFDVHIKVEDPISKAEQVSAPVDVIVDMTPPEAPEIAVDAAAEETKRSKAVLTITAGMDALSGVKETTVLLDGQPWQPDDTSALVRQLTADPKNQQKEIIIPTTYTLTTPGEYRVEAHSVDNAGNSSAISSQTIIITAPVPEEPEDPNQKPEDQEKPKPDEDKNNQDNNTQPNYGSSTQGTGTKAGGKDRNGRSLVLKDFAVVNGVTLASGYISGYPDGTFRPNGEITRAEFATILAKLLIFDTSKQTAALTYYSDTNKHWAVSSIVKLQRYEIIPAEGNRFRPNEPATRAEVVAALCQILNMGDYGTVTTLKDIGDSPYKAEIAKAYNAGIIDGYPDGSFHPKSTITRAEIVSMCNKIFNLQRTNQQNRFKDLKASAWYYDEVQKAAMQ